MQSYPYYEDQKDWSSDDFYCLHRYLHRMLFYYNKRMEEIKNIDLAALSEKTKAIMYCIIIYYNLNFLLDYKNLEGLKNCKPLNEPLIIDGDTSSDDDIYKTMNIIF